MLLAAKEFLEKVAEEKKLQIVGQKPADDSFDELCNELEKIEDLPKKGGFIFLAGRPCRN